MRTSKSRAVTVRPPGTPSTATSRILSGSGDGKRNSSAGNRSRPWSIASPSAAGGGDTVTFHAGPITASIRAGQPGAQVGLKPRRQRAARARRPDTPAPGRASAARPIGRPPRPPRAAANRRSKQDPRRSPSLQRIEIGGVGMSASGNRSTFIFPPGTGRAAAIARRSGRETRAWRRLPGGCRGRRSARPIAKGARWPRRRTRCDERGAGSRAPAPSRRPRRVAARQGVMYGLHPPVMPSSPSTRRASTNGSHIGNSAYSRSTSSGTRAGMRPVDRPQLDGDVHQLQLFLDRGARRAWRSRRADRPGSASAAVLASLAVLGRVLSCVSSM